jgi:sigma-B regulation protein RsbU (phosphoserine phosphatase)
VRLEERNRELENRVAAEGRVLELHQQDFERAREIQEALMPKKLPDIKGCRLAAGCQPARMVGGDYYDAIRLGDSQVAVAIADVCGKGMGAALLMSNLQAIVRAFASRELASADLCAKANQLISANVAPGKYVTFFYAIVDITGMRITYCNAGHNPPMLVRRDGTIRRLDEGGPVLGIFSDAAYAAGAAELTCGDRIVMFTDGVTEAMSATDEEFGEERLMALLSVDHASPAACKDQIMAAVTQFSSNGLHDDATIMVLQIN